MTRPKSPSWPWMSLALKVIGGVTGLIAIIGFPMLNQHRVDASQDTRIQSVEDRQKAATVELRAANRVLAEDTRKTAEALKAVASIVHEMDQRGTMAGREHERDRDLHGR